MTEWQPIETAPTDGSVIETKTVIEGADMFVGRSQWRSFAFPPYMEFPGYEFTGWMRVGTDKRTPAPTHWRRVVT